jgi:hypothetical protein
MEDKEKKTKKRSPNFPAISLPDAIIKTKILYDVDGRSGTPRQTAFKHLGYKGGHGASITVLSAMKKYGLIREENNRILLTKDAEFILLSSDELKKIEIVRKCALTPEIYSKLWEQYSDTGLPSDNSLKDVLLFDHDFNEKSVNGFIRDFKATIDFAQLEPHESFEIESEAEMIEDKPIIENNGKMNSSIQDYVIPRKENKVAILKLEMPISNEDIDVVIKWLDLLRSTIVSESEDI